MNTPAKLKRRQLIGEIMDQPDLNQQRHFDALRGLTRINRISRASSVMWDPIERLARGTGRPLRILDLATGAGDLPIRLWQLGQEAGLSLNIAACDKSPTALQYARNNARRAEADVKFFELDLIDDDIPGEYDVIICSLFLHHLEVPAVVELLRKIGDQVGQLLIVSDLRRSYGGYLLACLATRLLTRSHVVHVDGPRSVRAAFTISEIHDMARQADLVDVRLARKWPCRFLLTWKRP
ncbi:MAG: methyltransferase domain-containing protein [Pirellulaceae bacterium]